MVNNLLRTHLTASGASIVIVLAVVFGECLVVGTDVEDLSAPACPAGMSYDNSMELCVPRGMSFDSSFIPPAQCGSGGPAVCRGPVPRPPMPGGVPVERPGGRYRSGNRY